MSLLDNIFVNLKIISKVQNEGRISTTNPGQVKLENDGYSTTVWRTLTGDSREETVKYLITLIHDVGEISDNIINSLAISKNTQQENTSMFLLNENSKKCHQLRKLAKELKNSKRGIANLHNTYRKDANVTSKIEEVLDKIDVEIDKIERALFIIDPPESDVNRRKFIHARNIRESRHRIPQVHRHTTTIDSNIISDETDSESDNSPQLEF